MPRHPSLMLVLSRAARKALKSSQEGVAMLKAAGGVEQQFGVDRTLQSLLDAYLTTATTLVVNGGLPSNAPIERLTAALEQMTKVCDALRAGTPMPNTTIVGAVEVPRDVSAAWGKRAGGTA